MSDTAGVYPLRDVLDRVGCSDSWLRKRMRAGDLGDVAQVSGRRGREYRFTEEQVNRAAVLYGHRDGVALSRVELGAIAVATQADVERWRAIADDRAAQVDELKQERDALQHRVEVLLSMSLWGRIRGQHRGV